MKANGFGRTAKRTPVKGREISWTQAHEGRMRRFNLEVLLVALIALAFLHVGGFSKELNDVSGCSSSPVLGILTL